MMMAMIRRLNLSIINRITFARKHKKILNMALVCNNQINNPYSRRCYSVYEPDYLKLLEPEYPAYELLNVQVKGYDFTVLEHYAKYVEKTASHMGIDVEDRWPVPGKKLQVQSFKPGTLVVTREYNLTFYERNVQISNVSSVLFPIFIQVIQNSLPAGVKLTIQPNSQEHDDDRYIPDLELRDLRKELDEFGTKR